MQWAKSFFGYFTGGVRRGNGDAWHSPLGDLMLRGSDEAHPHAQGQQSNDDMLDDLPGPSSGGQEKHQQSSVRGQAAARGHQHQQQHRPSPKQGAAPRGFKRTVAQGPKNRPDVHVVPVLQDADQKDGGIQVSAPCKHASMHGHATPGGTSVQRRGPAQLICAASSLWTVLRCGQAGLHSGTMPCAANPLHPN
jgi:hypothetical protein